MGTPGELLPVGVDELHYLSCWRSSSAPKKLAACLSISLARRGSRTSCSRSCIRCDSLVVTPGVLCSPLSA